MKYNVVFSTLIGSNFVKYHLKSFYLKHQERISKKLFKNLIEDSIKIIYPQTQNVKFLISKNDINNSDCVIIYAFDFVKTRKILDIKLIEGEDYVIFNIVNKTKGDLEEFKSVVGILYSVFKKQPIGIKEELNEDAYNIKMLIEPIDVAVEKYGLKNPEKKEVGS